MSEFSIQTTIELDTDECLNEMDADDVRQWMRDNGHLNLCEVIEDADLTDVLECLDLDDVLAEISGPRMIGHLWEQDYNIGAWAMAGEGGETRLTSIIEQAYKANATEALRQISLARGEPSASPATLADLAKAAGGAANLLPELVSMIVAECRS